MRTCTRFLTKLTNLMGLSRPTQLGFHFPYYFQTGIFQAMWEPWSLLTEIWHKLCLLKHLSSEIKYLNPHRFDLDQKERIWSDWLCKLQMLEVRKTNFSADNSNPYLFRIFSASSATLSSLRYSILPRSLMSRYKWKQKLIFSDPVIFSNTI